MLVGVLLVLALLAPLPLVLRAYRAPDRAPRVRRRRSGAIPFAVAIALVVYGIALFLEPSTSTCHGSPVCALDGFEVLGRDLVGCFSIGLGGVALLFAAVVRDPSAPGPGRNLPRCQVLDTRR